MMRIAWWVVLAVVAAVAVGAETDFASVTRPALSLVVPGPFRSSAQLAQAGMAVAIGSPSEAISEAERLVRRRPLPADHLFLLAMARLRSGDTAGFSRAFRLATTRGWRNEPVQTIAAQSAIQQGDADAAANRIAALWAIGSASPEMRTLTRKLLAMPRGPEAFASRVSAGKVWRDHFLGEASALGSPAAIERLADAARAGGRGLSCTSDDEIAGWSCRDGFLTPTAR
jgi:hypothetical protein